MQALPFTIKNKPGEAGEITGLCRLDDGAVSIEWKKSSLIKRHQRQAELLLPLEDLEFARYQWGFFSARFMIRPRSLHLIADVPGSHSSGELNLRIARRDRAAAKELADSIDFALSEHRLERLSKSIGL